jgi:transposase-like protein/IS1 family transposase
MEEKDKCPMCDAADGQMKNGKNRSGTQTYLCRHCKKSYTPEPKRVAYDEETRKQALKIYDSRASGRKVGLILRMSKANVYDWIKKTPGNETTGNSQQVFNGYYELDELYWFVERKAKTETRENVYLMTMVSRKPRQIVGFDVAFDKSPGRIRAMVDNALWATAYFSDGWSDYKDVVYPGKYTQNFHNKNDTFTVEGVNADLRCYIPLLARRSRCV